MWRIAILLAVLSLVGSANEDTKTAPLKSVELPDALARVLRDYEKAWEAKDAKGLAELFTTDGFVLGNGAEPTRGREAIEKYYTGQGGPLTLRAFAFATNGDLGYIVGGYTPIAGESDVGKFTLTLRREDDRWFIFSDMDNGNPRRK